jgi:hypothetical protein
MKGENKSTEKSRKTDNNGQMILLAGFLVALTLISLAVVVGNSFYSQSSPDDGGISQLTSEVSNQIETAKDVGLQNIVKGNENATRFEGRNETEICRSLSNVTEEGVRDQLVLSDEEVLLEVDLVGDCDDFWSGNTSYAMGQQNNSRLPGVSVNDSVKEEKTFDCEQLRGNNFTCFDKSDNKEEFNDEVVDVITDKDSGPYPDEDIIPENYSEGNGTYNYTGDKIDALENVGDIKLDELPDGVSKQEFANCIGVDVETGDSFDCDDLRSASNLDEPGVEDDFQDELLDVVQNRTDGTDVPENYSESNNSGAYNYTGHKITALENLNGTSPSDVNLSALPEEIADEPEYDSPVEGLAACVDTTIKGEKFNCTELTSDEWVGLDNDKFVSELENVVENRSGGNYLSDNKIPESPEYNESANPSAYDYTQDKLYALDNMSSVDLDNDLPDVVEPDEFTECLNVALEPGENFTCSQIRNESGYNDGSNAADFSDELKQIVEDDPDAGGVGNVPTDYNESANDKYDYEQHKIDAINNVPGIVPGDISDGITDLDRYDTKAEALANCIIVDDIGRAPVDVVFSIDTTGSMGLDPDTGVGSGYESSRDPAFSPSEVGTPITQGHNERVNEYSSPNPYDIECYKEYDETGVPFPTTDGFYGDQDSANQGWCEGTAYTAGSFNTSVGSVGDYVYDDSPGAGEMVKVVSLPSSTATPSGVPDTWTRLTDDDVDTDNASEYCTTSGGSTADCATRNTDFSPGGSAGVGEVVEWTTYDITVDVTNYRGSFGGTDYYDVEYLGTTYTFISEDNLEYFEYKWAGPDATVENEFDTQRDVPIRYLNYIEYRWWPPDRLFLTQLGARAAMEDLVVGDDRVGLVQYSTSLSGDARTVEELNDLTSGYRGTLKEEIDKLRPGEGTDITEGIEQARNELETDVCKGTADRDATCHIVVMSDGNQTDGEYPYPDDYLENNAAAYENITVHAIALGSGANEDMMEDIAKPDGDDPVRPEGVFESSNDPEDAKDIFEDVIGSINEDRGDTTQGIDAINDSGNVTGVRNNVTAGGDDGNFDNVTLEANAGAIQKIYDLGMNFTEFNGTGTYSLNLTNVDGGAGEKVVWGMTVDNNFSDGEMPKTQVRFRADDSIVSEYDDDEEFLEDTFNVSNNFSKSSAYASVELAPDPNFEMADDDGVKFSSNGDYNITRVIDEVIQPEITENGVAVEMGTGNTPEAEANGTFSFDFKPADGNFSLVGDAAEGVCEEDGDGTMVTCGVEDTDNETWSTTRAKEVSFRVTVEGPGGVSNRTISVRIENALIGGGS